MKISPWTFKGVPQEVVDFKDEMTTAWNYGKYPFKTLVEGTPNWIGQEGETVYSYITGTAGTFNFYTYYYVNSAWRFTYFVGLT